MEPKQNKKRADRESKRRRPYEKPGFLTSVAFERQALGCSMGGDPPGPPPLGCNSGFS